MAHNNVVNLRGEGRALKISTGATVSNNRITKATVSWPDLTKKLFDTTRTKETLDQYLKLTREQQDGVKDVGYFVPGHYAGSVRKKSDLQGRDLLTLDLDFATPDWADEFDFSFDGYAYAVHTTHKHRTDKPRLRLVFPLVRTVNEIEYEAIARKVASWLDIDWFDDTTYQFGRVMHWPSTSKDGPFETKEGQGQWLDPDKVLAQYKNWKDAATWPISSREKKAPHIAAAKAEDPTTKKGVVGAFCRHYSISEAIEKFLPDIYTPGSGEGRYTYLKGSTSNGAVVYEDKWLYSHHGTDVAHCTLLNAFDLVRLHKFIDADEKVDEDTPVTKRPSWEKMMELCTSDPDVKVEVLKQRLDFTDSFDDLGDEIDGFDDVDELARVAWLKELELTSEGNIRITLPNLAIIFSNDPVLKGCVGYNEFRQRTMQRRSLPKYPIEDKINGDLWTDYCDILVEHYLERTYKTAFGEGRIRKVIELHSRSYAFHPVRAYLDNLSWDGVERLDTCLVDLLGAVDNEYTRAVTRKTLVAAVARIYEPGVKWDNVLVLEGLQGTRKSTFVETLAVRPEWFCDDISYGMDSKELVERTQGKWLVEVPEMVARTHAEKEHIKAFLSRKVENVRLSYGRHAEEYARQFVFFGTTNQDDYLIDETGNRRFNPVATKVGEIDTERVADIRDQLWAEAMVRYHEGEPLFLAGTAKEQATAMQASRVAIDPWVDLITNFLATPIPDGWYDCEPGPAEAFDGEDDCGLTDNEPRATTCIKEIWVDCIGGTLDRLDRRVSHRIGRIVTATLGWERGPNRRFGKRHGVQKSFVRPVT